VKKHTSSNPTFFFLVHYQVFTGLSALVGRGGGSTQKSLKKSHSCCPRLSNSNPHCETTQILHCCVHWGKNPSQHTHTHTHTFTHMVHTNQHYFHWGKNPTWTYTHIHTYVPHKSALLPLGKKTYVDIHTHSHLWYTQKNLRGHTYIHTYVTHKSALLAQGKKPTWTCMHSHL